MEPPVDVCDGLVCEQYGDKIIYTETSTVATIPAGADFILCYSVAEGFIFVLIQITYYKTDEKRKYCFIKQIFFKNNYWIILSSNITLLVCF